MKLDDKIDKLFKDKLENADIPDIPQSFLDDINQRLDAISPQLVGKKSSGVSSGFVAAVSVSIAIVSLIIYVAFFHNSKSKEAERAQNSIVQDTINISQEKVAEETSGEANGPTIVGNTIDENEKTETLKSKVTSDDLNNADENKGNSGSIASAEKQKDEHGKQMQANALSNKSITEPTSNNNNSKTNRESNSKGTTTRSNSSNRVDKSIKNTKGNKNKTFKEGPVAAKKSSMDNNDDMMDITIENKVALKDKAVKGKTTAKNKVTAKNKIKDKNEITDKNKATNEKKSSSIDLKKAGNQGDSKNKDVVENGSSTDNKKESGSENKVQKIDETKKELANVGNNEKVDSLKTQKKEIALSKIISTDSLKKTSKDSVLVFAKDSIKRNSADTLAQLKDSVKKIKTNGFKSVQFIVGYSHINSTFKSQNVNYDAKRKNEEQPIWAFDASVLVNYIKNKFVYTLGFNYSEWGEKIKYSAVTDSVKYIKGYDTTYVNKQIDSVTFALNPSVNTIYANKAITNNDVTLHNGKNVFSYVSIPFLLGYEFSGNRFSVTPKVGGMVGIPLKSKCYYISPDLSKLVQEKAAAWRVHVQVSVDVEAKISPYIGICVSPIYKYNVTPLINSPSTVNRYSGWGVQAGLSYILH